MALGKGPISLSAVANIQPMGAAAWSSIVLATMLPYDDDDDRPPRMGQLSRQPASQPLGPWQQTLLIDSKGERQSQMS